MNRIPAADVALVSLHERHLQTAKYSPVTIADRTEAVLRLARWLEVRGGNLSTASDADLAGYQETISDRARATVNIYTRHIQEFFRWALASEMLPADPSKRMVNVKVRPGVPHPIRDDDLGIVLSCASGGLRLAYVLAAFAGLRAGEIARLHGEDLQLERAHPTARICGKGDRERVVPLIAPVVTELASAGFPPGRGPVVTRPFGQPYPPKKLSIHSTLFMKEGGVRSTLHSCRHYFATEAMRATKDVLLVRDLLGHSSIATTQIYLASSMDDAEGRLAALSATATNLMTA